jgi:hypothetical protein
MPLATAHTPHREDDGQRGEREREREREEGGGGAEGDTEGRRHLEGCAVGTTPHRCRADQSAPQQPAIFIMTLPRADGGAATAACVYHLFVVFLRRRMHEPV